MSELRGGEAVQRWMHAHTRLMYAEACVLTAGGSFLALATCLIWAEPAKAMLVTSAAVVAGAAAGYVSAWRAYRKTLRPLDDA